MILKPSPIRKSPAPLRAALRALMVSACALTSPAALAHTSGHRRPVLSPTPNTHPYLAMLVPTPLRFAAPERPPAVLKIEPLPEEIIEEAATDETATTETSATGLPGGFFGDFGDFNFALPSTSDLDSSLAELDPANDSTAETNPNEEDQPKGPPPIILNEDSMRGDRAEDIMPFFRLPSNPSSATYRKQ